MHHDEPTTRIGATLFSGGRIAEALLTDAIDFRYAVEYDPQIAAVGAQLGGHTFVSRVQDVDYSTWGALDYLHASPVCKEFSQAKTNGSEGDEEITSALAVVRCMEQTQPRVFTCENVQGYLHSKSYRIITRALDMGGYMWHAEVLNSADFGVPQTRRRLIVRAVRDALLPGLPAPARWVGWYAAIEDLIPTLPESKFAKWQEDRLPAHIKGHTFFNNNAGTDDYTTLNHRAANEPASSVVSTPKSLTSYRAFIVDGQTNDGGALLTVPHGEQPMYTVSASAERRPARAWLVHTNDMRSMPTRAEDQPAFTITAASHNTHAPETRPKAWLQCGRVVRMTPRALARFQSVPDSYVLPDKAALACTVIGNGWPSLMASTIVRQLI